MFPAHSIRVVKALEGHRAQAAVIGQPWVFPARGCTQPTGLHTFVHWWNDVAEEAKLPPVRGRGFHSLRRKFATEMKHAPLKDLAYLGGWKSVQTVVNIYQRPDEVTMHRAFEARRPVGAGDRTQEQFDTTIRHQVSER